MDPELALGRSEGDAFVIAMDDEGGDALGARVRIGLGQHGVVLGDASPRDPALLPVEDPIASVADGARLHGGGVAAGFALGQAVGEHRLAAGHRREVAAEQIIVTSDHQRHRAELAARGDKRARCADACDLLDDDADRERIAALTAVLLGDVESVEAGGHEGVVDVVRELAGLVDLRCTRGDLVLCEPTHHLAELAMLLRQVKDSEVRVGRERHGDPPSSVPSGCQEPIGDVRGHHLGD